MFRKFYIVVLCIISLSLFGNIVIHSTSFNNPGGRFENMERFIVNFSSMPTNSVKIINCYIFNKQKSCAGFGKDEFTYTKHKSKKKGLNVFKKNIDDLEGYILFSRFFREKNKNFVHLFDIKNNKIIYEWNPDINAINKLSNFDRNQKNLEINANRNRYLFYHPYLSEDGSIITHSSSPLIKIDRCSKLVWQIDKRFHHSISIDHENNFWIPTLEVPGDFKELHNQYHDDKIAKVSFDGKLIYEKSVTEILKENDLFNLILNTYYGDDPIHLNDIEPILDDSSYWKKGDVFLSLRSISAIILFRPATNKIIWYKQGPWRFQHDIDVIDEDKIAIFDNNVTLGWDQSQTNNNIYIYDFKSDKAYKKYEDLFRNNDINSRTGSLYRILDNGDIYVEEENHGRLLMGTEKGELKWEFIWNSLINWSRYISEKEFEKLNFIDQKC